jgi:hypothetical protein
MRNRQTLKWDIAGHMSRTTITPAQQHVTLTQAGDNARMNRFIVEPVKIQLGSTEYSGDLHVAPLRDPMLLGMEFLQQRKVHLDLGNGLMISD